MFVLLMMKIVLYTNYIELVKLNRIFIDEITATMLTRCWKLKVQTRYVAIEVSYIKSFVMLYNVIVPTSNKRKIWWNIKF